MLKGTIVFCATYCRRFFLTIAIIFLSLWPFAVLQWQGLGAISIWFMPPSINELFAKLELWRLLSPIFVHYTLPHLLVNLYLWWYFANRIEEYSKWILLSLTLGSAILGNLAQHWLTGYKFGGLSGVVYGLLGFLWLSNRLHPQQPLDVDSRLTIALMVALVLAATGWLGAFSNGAHIAGLVFGLFFAYAHHLYCFR